LQSSLRIVELSGVPTHGGTVAAICEWQVEREVVDRAGGNPVFVASHVRDGDGRTIDYDGPRSLPVSGAQEVVVPLSLPGGPGTCLVDLDAVVEGRFWASSLGLRFPTLRIERSAEGSIRGEEMGGARRFRVEAMRSFRIPRRSYGAGESERCVEIPWVLSRYQGERRVLDIGTSFAERRYLEALRSLHVPSLFALDLVPAKSLRAIVGDARTPPLRDGIFDAIFAISVIEHIGRDNAVYLQGRHGPADAEGDFTSIRALGALLAPGGRLLVTVPFGEREDHGWFVQYDIDRLDRLIAASGLQVEEREFFRYGGGWTGSHEPRDLRGCKYGVDAMAASGLACLSLVNDSGMVGRLRRWLRRPFDFALVP